jgi:hypothetical protein
MNGMNSNNVAARMQPVVENMNNSSPLLGGSKSQLNASYIAGDMV